MRGLKTQESEKFNRFWDLIQTTAAKKGCVFFGYAGEGRDFSTSDMEGEDFGGWLVPMESADSFERVWTSNPAALFQSPPSGTEFTFAIWNEQSGNITVDFKNFQ